MQRPLSDSILTDVSLNSKTETKCIPCLVAMRCCYALLTGAIAVGEELETRSAVLDGQVAGVASNVLS